jgi:hypothetical protein
MKKVFLDTNILMDFIENREKREYAETIIELGKIGAIQLFASYLGSADFPGWQRPELIKNKVWPACT